MWEWLAVALAGSGGGLIGTFLPSGTDVPWPGPIRTLMGGSSHDNPWRHLLAHAVRNSIGGGVGAFIVWAGHNTDVLFSATGPTVFTVAFAATIGLGGIAILNRLVKSGELIERRGTAVAEAEEFISRLEESQPRVGVGESEEGPDDGSRA